MEERDLFINLIDLSTKQMEQSDKYNKRFFLLTLTAIIVITLSMSVVMMYFTNNYFNTPYEYPEQSVTNTNTNTNTNGGIE